MKTKKYDGTEVRLILTGMILDQTVIARVTNQWQIEGLFDSKWANMIGGWCVTYFKKFSAPPGKRIQRIFELESSKMDEKTSEAIEHFLLSLSDEFDDVDVVSGQVLEVAGTYFQRVRLKSELEAAAVEIDNGLIDQALNRTQSIKRVNLEVGNHVNVATDMAAWHRAFNQEQQKPLVRYPGPLGEFTEGAFTRGSFYAILAPDKTGKTTWLLDLAYRAVRQRNNVAYFDMGDSIEEEVMQRLALRSAAQPEFDSTLKIPTEWGENNEPHLVEMFYPAAEEYSAHRQFRKICKSDDAMKISCHLNSSATVGDIDSILGDWAREGWLPDVVVIDYADILARPKGIIDKIEAIDENWKAMRRMSQKRKCLVMTATQSKATGYSKTESLLGPEDFSGSKTKNAHVNGMLAINVSPKEKEWGAARISWPVRRKRASNVRWYCRTAGCYAIGNPAIISKIGT